jgi:2-oxoglutarate dehydrogenase E2 component (dihydrolipoamide succinyltransferase)
MPTKLVMPLLGESVTDATVTKWLKSTGDKVEEYEPLLEVNTDKVDTEIPSPTSGVILAEFAKEGELVKVGALLGWIGQPGEAIPLEGTPEGPVASIAPSQPVANLTPISTIQPTLPRELGFISPVVAKIAAERNVDLSKVPGTGMGGRITKKDIEKYLEAGIQIPAVPLPSAQPAPTPRAPTESTPAVVPAAVLSVAGPYTVIPQTPIRKAIAEHMVMSEHTAPHVSTIMEVDMTCVSAHRTSNKEIFAAQGVNLTYTAFTMPLILAWQPL